MDHQMNIEKVSNNTAKAYQLAQAAMIGEVNEAVAALPNVSDLLGGNSLKTAFTNHRNHAAFMANVFLMNDYRMLEETLPWVYHAYGSHGFSRDYFPEVVRAFMNACNGNLVGDAAQEVGQVYQWILDRHHEIAQKAISHQWIADETPKTWLKTRDTFLKALLKKDRQAILQMGRGYFGDPQKLEDFYLYVVEPSLYEIGDLWENGDISVADEHAASAVVTRLIAGRPIISPKDTSLKGRALVTAAPGELHQIGAWMVADCLETNGWLVDYLGADTPMADLLEFLQRTSFQLLAVSVTMPYYLESVQELIGEVRRTFRESAPNIMVGGMVLRKWPELGRSLGADGVASNCREATELAAHWFGEWNDAAG